MRQAAGERFDRVELSMVIAPILTTERGQAAEHCARQHGWTAVRPQDVLAMPSIFIGSVDEIADHMLERRERFGVSYYIVSDAGMEALAPIVARLTGA